VKVLFAAVKVLLAAVKVLLAAVKVLLAAVKVLFAAVKVLFAAAKVLFTAVKTRFAAAKTRFANGGSGGAPRALSILAFALIWAISRPAAGMAGKTPAEGVARNAVRAQGETSLSYLFGGAIC
jgi:hypothetical protein